MYLVCNVCMSVINGKMVIYDAQLYSIENIYVMDRFGSGPSSWVG